MLEISDIERKLTNVNKKLEENTLALEIIKDYKAQAKRKDIIILVLIGVIISMIIAFFVYESQFETITEESTQETYYTDSSEITQTIQ